MFCFFLFFLTVALTNFLDSSVGEESACNGGVSRDTGSILGSEDPLEEGMAAHSSILAGESRGQRSLARYSPWGCKESDTTERSATNQYTLFLSHSHQMHYWILLVLLSIPPEADLANATIQVPGSFSPSVLLQQPSERSPCCHFYSPLPQQPDWSVRAEVR